MKLNEIIDQLFEYHSKVNYEGYDPHDGLLSPLIQLPFIRSSKWIKLAFLQLNKRLIYNLRPVFFIPKHRNPKTLALVLSAHMRYRQTANGLTLVIKELLKQDKSPFYKHYCWGYPFDWQARAFFQKKNMPTVVASSFVAHSLLDVFERTGDEETFAMAESTASFFESYLNRTKLKTGFAFSYSPEDKSVVFNATALGASLLARIYDITKKSKWADLAFESIQVLKDNQNEDGSWAYGLQKHHQWIDNFHTGYNLEALYRVINYLKVSDFNDVYANGERFYLQNLFEHEGFPKYYYHQKYPADMHAPSQLFSYLYTSKSYHKNQILADKVLQWSLNNMWNEKTQLFIYQLHSHYANKINYLRWTQSWALYGLASYAGAQNQ